MLAQALAGVFVSHPKASVDASFARFDTDGSGTLETTELCACVRVSALVDWGSF